MAAKLEKLPHSRVRLTVTVDEATLQKHYDQAVKKVSEHLEIKGFRKGHAPKAMVIKQAGNPAILQEMIDLVLPDTYYTALADHKDVVPVTQPSVDVKELKDLSETQLIPTSMTYTAEVDVMPEVTIGDYKKIRIKPKTAPETIDPKELDKTVEEIKKMYGDDYLTAGQFKNDEEMRKAVEENIKQQKIFEAQSQTYDLIIEEVLKKVKAEVPEAFIHNEIHRMEHQVEMQAKAYGLTFDDWLKAEKKTHEEIHKEWHPQAEKAAKIGLALGKIAEMEGIDPSQNDASRLVLEKLHDYTTGKTGN